MHASSIRRSLLTSLVAWAIATTASAADTKSARSLYADSTHNNIASALPRLIGSDRDNASLIAKFPIAAWFSGGTPAQVQSSVRELVTAAAAKDQLPVLVAYNLPLRDCQQYSSGGASNSAEYHAWIDGFASGIGTHRAIVIIEPDSLGIIPHYTSLTGTKEWCQPKSAAASAAEERLRQLNYAVDAIAKLPNATAYLDGTHSAWLDVGDSAHRLVRAGVQHTRGFFLNVSNYRPNEELIRYGTWISQCIQYATERGGSIKYFSECPTYTAKQNVDEATIKTINEWYAKRVKSAAKNAAHFVIDTSRNGRGAWIPPSNKYTDAEAWCNPPGRGLGERPTLISTHPLLDAKLWIKVPGESDGECKRGTQGPKDPERGIVDPPAGQWFKEQADELIQFAKPPVTR